MPQLVERSACRLLLLLSAVPCDTWSELYAELFHPFVYSLLNETAGVQISVRLVAPDLRDQWPARLTLYVLPIDGLMLDDATYDDFSFYDKSSRGGQFGTKQVVAIKSDLALDIGLHHVMLPLRRGRHVTRIFADSVLIASSELVVSDEESLSSALQHDPSILERDERRSGVAVGLKVEHFHRQIFPEPSPQLTVAAVSCVRLELMLQTLASTIEYLEGRESHIRYEIAWIDNGSGRIARDLASKLPIEQVLHFAFRLELAAAINTVAQLARSRFILLVEEDFVIRSDVYDVLSRGMDVIETDQRVLQVSFRNDFTGRATEQTWLRTPNGTRHLWLMVVIVDKALWLMIVIIDEALWFMIVIINKGYGL